MSEQGRRGGIQFGNVGGSVSVQAGGDVVGGDKTTRITVSGFRSDAEKLQFQGDLETLRSILREVKGHLESSADLAGDDKDELTAETLSHVKALKEVNEATSTLSPGQAPPAAKN